MAYTEEHLRQALASLAAPLAEEQWRGQQWRPPLDEDYEDFDGKELDDYKKLEDRAVLWPVLETFFLRTLYDPLQDTPLAYLDLVEFGEKVWSNGLKFNEGLIADTIELLEKYGPLDPHDMSSTQGVRAHEYWDAARKLALGVLCYQSIEPDGLALRETVIERIIEVLTDDRAQLFPWTQSSVLYRRSVKELKASATEWARFQADPEQGGGSAYPDRARGWLTELINWGMAKFGVASQVSVDEDGRWTAAYRAATLGGAMWAQFSAAVLSSSRLRYCKYERCRLLFPDPSGRKEFHLAKCKDNRKKWNRRHPEVGESLQKEREVSDAKS